MKEKITIDRCGNTNPSFNWPVGKIYQENFNALNNITFHHLHAGTEDDHLTEHNSHVVAFFRVIPKMKVDNSTDSIENILNELA